MGKRPNYFLDRYRSRAWLTSASARPGSESTGSLPIINPLAQTNSSNNSKAGGRDVNQNGSGLPCQADGGAVRSNSSSSSEEKSSGNDTDAASAVTPAAAPAHKSEDALAGNPTLKPGDAEKSPKPPLSQRVKTGSKAIGLYFKNALFHSWINVLLIFVPAGIAVEAIGAHPAVIFAVNSVAIVPLAGLLAYATESVAARLGDTMGALLNVSFGNAVELIIFIIALVKNEIEIVQASILGSILANLLLILGMAFLLGGLRYREQIYNSTVTQMSACLLSLSVMSLLLPTAFHAAFNDSSIALADSSTLKVSRGTSVVLLAIYILYLLFQLKSHAYMYESTPQDIIDEESHPGVLADLYNSSSSSSEDSDSDSSDSSASGSIIAGTGRRVKRMFKHRRRRRSNATTSSAVTSPSVISAVSTMERTEYPWLQQVRHAPISVSRRVSTATDGNEAELEHDGSSPRVRDFGDQLPENEEAKYIEPKVTEIKKHSKFRHYRRHHKHKHHRHHKDSATDDEKSAIKEEESKPEAADAPKVGFSDEIQIVPNQSNEMQRQSKFTVFRPALPKMLANNVFVQPAPVPNPIVRPVSVRSQSTPAKVKRSNSLPENLLHQPLTQTISMPVRLDPLPPFQHQLRQAKPEGGEAAAAEGEDEHQLPMSRTSAVILLLLSTVLVAICAEFMVGAIPEMIESSVVSQAFIGLIILPIVGNAAEHVAAVTVAAKNKMDLAIGIAVGSSIQIALFITPFVVLLGWFMGRDMTLYFNIFDTVCLFVTAFVVNFLILDGRSNYLEGALLIASYVIISVGAFFYPGHGSQSGIGSGGA